MPAVGIDGVDAAEHVVVIRQQMDEAPGVDVLAHQEGRHQADAHAAQQDRPPGIAVVDLEPRSEEHTSELQSLMRISYAVFCLKKTTNKKRINTAQHRLEKTT